MPCLCAKFAIPVLPWYSRQKFLRVTMLRVVENVTGCACFNDLSITHDCQTITYLRGDPKVMGDEHHRQIHLFSDFVQKFQNLCLDRNVEGGYRLIGDQYFWIQSQSARNAYPLALTTRKLCG